ncbi:hypothetical protein SLS60_006363 [Paraconiothyrium brasiliense]|uniref:Uncharacterized protein n=1 Tax=Paraconiothyrium brasiliense TaxID=300254 RepID=A0ABR3RAJ7_9PLEO
MTANPFSDHLYRIDSNEHIDVGESLAFPVPYLTQLPPMSTSSPISSAEVSPASTAPSTPPLPSPPLEWTAGTLNYLFSALYPEQMASDSMVLESHPIKSWALFSPIRLDLYIRTKSTPVPAWAYAATAPIGTGRPTSRVLLAQASGGTVAQARRALAKQFIGRLSYFTNYYDILAELYTLDDPALRSLIRGIEGMKRVPERELMQRLLRLRDAGVDREWGFEARFELFLLYGGWRRVGHVPELALKLGLEERKVLAQFYGGVVDFLEMVGADLAVC